MHTTQTVDYGIVLEGEVWLEVDDGKEVHLKPHDVVVQNGDAACLAEQKRQARQNRIRSDWGHEELIAASASRRRGARGPTCTSRAALFRINRGAEVGCNCTAWTQARRIVFSRLMSEV